MTKNKVLGEFVQIKKLFCVLSILIGTRIQNKIGTKRFFFNKVIVNIVILVYDAILR